MNIMDMHSRQVLAQYTTDALDILNHSIALYAEGNIYFYRVVAVQLRLLLCDTTFRHGHHENCALVPQLFPEIRLHPLDVAGHPQLDQPSLDLPAWLEQPASVAPGLTIRTLIRRLCDLDGGAHVDTRPLAGLPANRETRQWLIDLAASIAPILAQALSG